MAKILVIFVKNDNKKYDEGILKGGGCGNFGKSYIFIKALENGFNQLSLCGSKACEGMVR